MQNTRDIRNPFKSVTSVAIEEIIKNKAAPSKFGYFINEDTMKEIVTDLSLLLNTSRNLKSAGDRLLSQNKPGRVQTRF